jgi:hypothetical protein
MRRPCAIKALSLCLALASGAASSATSPRGACHLVDAAAQNQITAAKDGAAVAKEIITHPDKPSQTACLAGIIKGGGDSMLTIPSLGDVFDNMTDRACNALEDSWNKATEVLTQRAELPYGLGSVSTGNGGYEVGGIFGDGVGAVNEGAGAVKDAADEIRRRQEAAEKRSGGSDNATYGGGSSNVPNIYE